jgi:hypothetical protein
MNSYQQTSQKRHSDYFVSLKPQLRTALSTLKTNLHFLTTPFAA